MTAWTRRRFAADDSGVVYIEFLITFFPLLFTFLCTVQLGLLVSTRLAVQHAATVGARAAMVVFVEDPKHYGGEARRAVSLGKQTAERGEAPRLDAAPPTDAKRAEAVRRAVAFLLAPFAPAWSLGTSGALRLSPFGTSVRDAVDGVASRLAFGASAYPSIGLTVAFPRSPGSEALFDRRIGGDRVTVRVTYLASCAVPVASRLLCEGLSLLPQTRKGSGHALSSVGSPALLRTALMMGARFHVFQAEATMPIQSAGYEQEGT